MTNARIYVVEDDPLIVMDVTRTLKERGFDVVGSADSAEQALKEIAGASPDLVLMDIQLKGAMDGVEAAKELGNIRNIPVVFLTGIVDEQTLQRAKLTMPYGYIVKPFEPLELSTAIDLIMARRQRAAGMQNGVPHQEDEDVSFEIIEGDAESKVEALAKLECFRDVPRQLLTAFAEHVSIRSLEGGSFIFNEEEESQGGFVILSGKISITKSAATGKELIVSLLGAGDTYGLFYLLKGFGRCCSARTQVASRILWIPRSAFLSLEGQYPLIYRSLCESLAKRLGQSYELASSLAHSRVEDRIVTTLFSLLPRLGHSTQNNANTPRLFMTRKELADLTGTTPETAIRVTKNLEREGYLDLSRPGIIKIVDLEGLKRVSDH